MQKIKRGCLIAGLLLAALWGAGFGGLPGAGQGQSGLEPFRATAAAPASQVYANARYGFSIAYPGDFSAGRPPANGDGLRFSSPDRQAHLSVFGGNNLGMTVDVYYRNSLQAVNGEIAYTSRGEDWYVITWRERDKIYYVKSFVGRESHNGFVFSYPTDQAADYADVVTLLENTFKPGDLDSAH